MQPKQCLKVNIKLSYPVLEKGERSSVKERKEEKIKLKTLAEGNNKNQSIK
jgi:hypothetical protein